MGGQPWAESWMWFSVCNTEQVAFSSKGDADDQHGEDREVPAPSGT